MTKVDPTAGNYSPTSYVTPDEITGHFGVTSIDDLPTEKQQRYKDYALQANSQTEAVIYKYIDKLPLKENDEALLYAKSMAKWYAFWLKAADDGAPNVAQLKELWEGFKENLIKVFMSQPKQATIRHMVSDGYKDRVTPYSQSYGLSDIL